MSSPHVEGINWFPRSSDYFVTWGSEINLYKIVPKSKPDNSSSKRTFPEVALLPLNTLFPPLDLFLDLSHTKNEGQLEYTETIYSDIRCLAPSFQDKQLITAVGLANGKVCLCCLYPSVEAAGEISE